MLKLIVTKIYISENLNYLVKIVFLEIIFISFTSWGKIEISTYLDNHRNLLIFET